MQKDKIKILYVIESLQHGGAEIQLLNLVSNSDRSKVKSIVCALNTGGNLVNEFKKKGIEVILLKKKGRLGLRRILDIAHIVKDRDIDIVNTYLASADIIGRIGAILSKAPIIISSRRSLCLDPSSFLTDFAYGVVDFILSRFTYLFIANSNAVRDAHKKRLAIKDNRWRTIYNAVDFKRLKASDDFNIKEKKEALSIPFNSPVVGMVANLTPTKRHEVLIKAARIVIQSFPEARFLLVGDGRRRKNLIDLSRKLGLSKNIIFLGYRRNIPELISLFDVAVLSSDFREGLPNGILEPMSQGKPVVVTNVGGCTEAVKDGKNGLVVEKGDYKAMAKAIEKLLGNSHLRENMGKAGLERIRTHFNIERLVSETENLYESLIKQSSFSKNRSCMEK